LEVLTFGVELFLVLSVGADGPRGAGGRFVSTLFVVCSLCSCPPSFSICCVFEFWFGEVSDGPRVPGGQSTGAWRDSPRAPRGRSVIWGLYWRFCLLFWIVRGSGPDGPWCGCGQSAAAGQTVRVACADSPRGLCGQSAPPGRTVRQSLAALFLGLILPSFFRASACASRNRS
jgi:hypothetical protein